MSTKAKDTRKFHLKPFSLSHHNSSMKAGTDSMLLGRWTDPSGATAILDIGTGCGILALYMAYRSTAMVEAVELDPPSFREARKNFHESPFHKRLKIIEMDFNKYVHSCTKQYDLIISNPPFFVNDMRPSNKQRKEARHTDALSYHQLAAGCKSLLSEKGRFSLVLPYGESRQFMLIAGQEGLFAQRQMVIFPARGLQPNRVHLELGFEKADNVKTELFTIREEDGNFSNQFLEFMKDYYISSFH